MGQVCGRSSTGLAGRIEGHRSVNLFHITKGYRALEITGHCRSQVTPGRSRSFQVKVRQVGNMDWKYGLQVKADSLRQGVAVVVVVFVCHRCCMFNIYVCRRSWLLLLLLLVLSFVQSSYLLLSLLLFFIVVMEYVVGCCGGEVLS